MVKALDTRRQRAGASAVPRSRHVVIFNWRDMKHPQAGGAEKVTHEIARRWVEQGHRVTLFAASFPGARPEEVLDGVRVVRRGSQVTVHWEAYRFYRRHLRRRCDVIIDEVNTIPFFAPLYAREPVIMFAHQLARDVWHYEAPRPLNIVGYLAEPLYLQPYRRTPVMTVSQSTKADMQRLGLRGPYRIIPEAVDTQPLTPLPPLGDKEPFLTLVFVGRVVPSKRVDHLIRALRAVRDSGQPEARLWLIGSCDASYRSLLNGLIDSLGLGDSVEFLGRVDEAAKEELLARAHVFAMASVREGWGLAVTEANLLGTPAVVYDVPGLRDSTWDGETGLVCKRNTPQGLAEAVLALYGDPHLYARMRERAWLTARELNWDRTAAEAWDAVEPWLS